jgi:Cft2 family RNA processing exonuclease
MEYALEVKSCVKQVFLVHGEPEAAGILREKLYDEGLERVSYPVRHEEVEVS